MREARKNPAADDSRGKLIAKLRELFQLDRGDLDFGLYRIMKKKSADVCKFLHEELPKRVKTALQESNDARRAELERQLDGVIYKAKSLGSGIDIEKIDTVKELRAQLAAPEMAADKNAEADVYDHLTKFFERYYSDGDFISQRRYTSGANTAYLIPYDGEEVKLHWANADQYYIKTTKNYASYVFALGDNARRVRFEIAKADNEKDNIKEANGKQRRFVLAGKGALKGKEAVAVEEGGLVIRFEHRPLNEKEKRKWPGNGNHQQSRINKSTEDSILQWKDLDPNWPALLDKPASTSTDADNGCSVLAKHVERYTAENSFDYFIHKDLGGFLHRELDLYLKNEVLDLDDVADANSARLRRAHARMRAIRQVAEKIITFLAQLENFQKTLWLKKKFVLETQYCVTLDKVPESLYADIIASDAQRAEWVALFAIDETNSDLAASGYSEPLTAEFLKGNPFLVLDTRYFDCAFTNKLLAALSEWGGLDEQLDGLLVHGENFQALNLLQARYQGEVKCVYIDPPYNTAASPIIYKNNYKHSAWLTLMENRILHAAHMLMNDSVFIVAIDDTEMTRLNHLLENCFPDRDRNVVVVNHHPGGAGLEGSNISSTHEYAIFMTPLNTKILHGEMKEAGLTERGFSRGGTADSNLRIGRPNSFYAILVDPETNKILGAERPPQGADYPKGDTAEGWKRIYPIGADGSERVWRRSYESFLNECEKDTIICKNGKSIYQVIDESNRRRPIFSNWTDKKYNAGFHGGTLLTNIMGEVGAFSYPKSIHNVQDCVKYSIGDDAGAVVLDFFAGSGTTGHAVININREDEGKRKYILVEVGHHFDDVLLPRIKKAVYSKKWEDGKPCDREGISQFVKYIRLESYEDTLDNLEVTLPNADQQDVLAKNSKLAADYQLRYALRAETAHNASLLGEDFSDPFAYKLSVVRDGVPDTEKADLVDTFNYLLGLRVSTRSMLDDVLAIIGTDARKRACLILWRNPATMDGEKLNAWLTTHRAQFPNKLDMVYVNGDSALNSANRSGETWVAQAIGPVFRELMFGGKTDA